MQAHTPWFNVQSYPLWRTMRTTEARGPEYTLQGNLSGRQRRQMTQDDSGNFGSGGRIISTHVHSSNTSLHCNCAFHTPQNYVANMFKICIRPIGGDDISTAEISYLFDNTVNKPNLDNLRITEHIPPQFIAPVHVYNSSIAESRRIVNLCSYCKHGMAYKQKDTLYSKEGGDGTSFDSSSLSNRKPGEGPHQAGHAGHDLTATHNVRKKAHLN
ncbi:hypothetical protein BDV96DRAFT_607079 [Lophiotrema nucula]|uniref:Uncharacterized protein n=1 Tax=Lophiotrema nucula TaxID=690887 RepID=A0A6A5YIA8_9PLEO|nr:hypothetical protein BDV96DRAFT_607079 [Lophiotrema nucula]